MMMSFIWPYMLFFLLLVPLFVGLYLLMQQRRQRLAARYSSLGLVQGAQGRGPGIRRHVPPLLFLAGLTVLVLALARPQTVVSLPRIEGTVILAFDVSGSMAADDLHPNRMEAAKAAARDFVLRQPSTVQIGVVAFSDGGLAVQAPTNDQDTILSAIDRLAPQLGTSLGHGILVSLHTIARDAGQDAPEQVSDQTPQLLSPAEIGLEGSYPAAIIVLISDGENNVPPDPLEAAQIAASLDVRIYTVGVGSPGGTILHLDGFSVHTLLDEATLQRIAQISGGAYFHAGDEEDLQQIYRGLTPQLVVKPEKMEVTSIFAGISLLLLLVSGAFSLFWFSRLP